MPELELDENFHIRQSGCNVLLVELKPGTSKEGEPIVKEVLHNYGAVYQALGGYIKYSCNYANTVKDIRKIAVKCISIIEKFELEIKEKFRCEVRVK